MDGKWRKDPEEVKIETDNLKGMIKLLIEKGIHIDEVDDEKKTAFELALEKNSINILPLLTENVSLSKTPMLFHRFTKKFFDERYRDILTGLVEAEENISEETMNTLDYKGFNPFLAYIRAFVDERLWLSQRISVILDHQEFLHKKQTSKYKINNIDLFDWEEPESEAYRSWQNTRHNP